MLSQNAESLSGLSVLFTGTSSLLSEGDKSARFPPADSIDSLFCRTLSAVMYCGSDAVWKNLSMLSRVERGGGGGGGDGGADASLGKMSIDKMSFGAMPTGGAVFFLRTRGDGGVTFRRPVGVVTFPLVPKFVSRAQSSPRMASWTQFYKTYLRP
jgi:hypothetical protein